MFKKNDFKLKADFRKLLLSTNEYYQTSLKVEEQKAIILMWSKIVGDNGGISVFRFQKQGCRLGIMINTTSSDLGSIHEITNIAEKSYFSKTSKIETGDILLEVNGVNLLLLTYSQLVLTLGALPNNVQFIIWKKEGEGIYERPDSIDFLSCEDNSTISKENESAWSPEISIIVQSSRIKNHGLEFINNMPEYRNASKCVLQKIAKDGYIFEDKRISINDSITQLNSYDLRQLSYKEVQKAFSNNKQSALFLRIRKYNSWRCTSDTRSNAESKLNLSVHLKDTLQRKQLNYSTPNLSSAKSISKSIRTVVYSLTERKKSISMTLIKDSYDTVSFNLDPSDDLKVFLVDVKEAGQHKSVICGFQPDSTLRKKFRFKDQIVKINDEDVSLKSSKEIGFILKKFAHKKVPVLISVLRKSKEDLFNGFDNLISSSEILTTESGISSNLSEELPQTVVNDALSEKIIYVTLCKVDNSFGLCVEDIDGPTITKVTPDLETNKSGLVQVNDKILKINGIYVKDKEHTFVLTIIRSCDQKIDLELLRRSPKDLDIQTFENPIYFNKQNINSRSSLHLISNNNYSTFPPLPPLPPVSEGSSYSEPKMRRK